EKRASRGQPTAPGPPTPSGGCPIPRNSPTSGATAAGFWQRAVKWFKRHRIGRIRRVVTDNGFCYRSWAFAAALAASKTRHKRTRPYWPQTNGKVERYHRTMATEWLYSRSWTSNQHRHHALQGWLDHYNYHRPHSSLGGRPPISRCTPNTDTNLPT